MIEPGTKAPDFTLRDQDGNKITLSELRGQKVILAFYPKDFSPACSDQLSIYQEVMGEIEARGAKLLGISVDHTWAHSAFRAKLGLQMTLLADFHPKGEVCRAYGAYIEDRGYANRSLVLVDEDGAVAWCHAAATPAEIPGANLIFDALASS